MSMACKNRRKGFVQLTEGKIVPSQVGISSPPFEVEETIIPDHILLDSVITSTPEKRKSRFDSPEYILGLGGLVEQIPSSEKRILTLQNLIYPNKLDQTMPWNLKMPGNGNRFDVVSQLLSPKHIVREILKEQNLNCLSKSQVVPLTFDLSASVNTKTQEDNTSSFASIPLSPENILGAIVEWRCSPPETGIKNIEKKISSKDFPLPGLISSRTSGEVFQSGSENQNELSNDSSKKSTLKKPPKPFVCVKCFKSFTFERKLWVHICDPNTIECDVCGERMPDRLTLEKHESANECGICQDCGKEFLEAAAFKAHKLLDHPEGASFKCLKCKISFPKVNGLTNHIRKVHSKSALDCDICGKSLPNARTLKEHISRSTCAKCVECGQVFTDLYAFRAHKQEANIYKKNRTCDVCQTNFSKLASITHYMGTVHPSETHDCKLCGKKLIDTQRFEEHQELQSDSINKHCSKKCVEMFELKTSRLRSYSVNAQYKCPKCAVSFGTTKGLTCHIRMIHRGSNAYSCLVCYKSFVTIRELKSHRKSHKGRQFKCSDCGKLFTTKTYMETHKRRVHTSDKPYKCPQCLKTFQVQSVLASHVQKVHNLKRCTRENERKKRP